MTMQVMDSIYWQGSMYGLLSTIKLRPSHHDKIHHELTKKNHTIHSGFQKGYIATWAIVNEKLFVIDILNIKNESLFLPVFGESPRHASWVNDTIDIFIEGNHPYFMTSPDDYIKRVSMDIFKGRVYGFKEIESGTQKKMAITTESQVIIKKTHT